MSAWMSSEQLSELLDRLDEVIGRDAEDRKHLAIVYRALRNKHLDSLEHDATGRRPADQDDITGVDHVG